MIMRRLVLAGAVAGVLSACGGGSTGSSTGTVTVGVTDAPVDSAEAVVVEFTGVEVRPADGAPISIDYAEPKSLDLLQLQNGVRELLLDGYELPEGRYTQVRLKVSAQHDGVMDSYIQIDGAQHELRVSSGDQTGLKLIHPFNVVSGVPVDLTIDFDLRKSIVQTGPVTDAPDANEYGLKPTLRLVATQLAGEISGTIADTAFTGLTCAANNEGYYDYTVYVFAGSDIVPDDVDGNGDPISTAKAVYNVETGLYDYTAAFLPSGDYTVSATCEAAIDDPLTDDALNFVGTGNVAVTTGGTASYSIE